MTAVQCDPPSGRINTSLRFQLPVAFSERDNVCYVAYTRRTGHFDANRTRIYSKGYANGKGRVIELAASRRYRQQSVRLSDARRHGTNNRQSKMGLSKCDQSSLALSAINNPLIMILQYTTKRRPSKMVTRFRLAEGGLNTVIGP